MSRIIIGIHGLGNKPPESILERWWRLAIKEGLKANERPFPPFRFEMIYWANILYPEPLNPLEKDAKSLLFIDEPYIPANSFKRRQLSRLRRKIVDYVDHYLDKIFLNKDMSINYTAFTDLIIGHYFKDLETYYNASLPINGIERPVKDIIREHVADKLAKHRKKKILLIGHSMGSIIAYDVMTQCLPDLEIDTFISIGSPLGIPVIKSKILSENRLNGIGDQNLRTPENVIKNWYNFSDLEDRIAVDYKLEDDYEENAHKVRAIDIEVSNNYEYKGERNPHKSYGYLRTPEIARVIRAFLVRDRKKWMVWTMEKLNSLLPSKV